MVSTTPFHLLESIEDKKGRSRVLHSRGRILKTVEKINAHPESRSFVNLLESDSGVRRLFSLHWTQISLLEEMSLPIFFSLSGSDEDTHRAVEREAKKGEELGEFTVERILKDAEPRLEEHLAKIQRDLRKAGKIYGFVDEGVFVYHLLRSLGLLSRGSPLRGIAKLLKRYEDHIADEGLEVLSALLAAGKSRTLAFGVGRRARLMASTQMDGVEYERCLVALLDGGFLRPLLSLVWCEGHKELPTSAYVAGHRCLPILTCDVCGKPLSHGTFYFLSSGAMTLARQYDGIIPYLIALALEERGIPWNSEVFLRGEPAEVEKDLVYMIPGRGLVLVECKTFATDVPPRTMKSNIQKSLKQISAQVERLKAKGIEPFLAALALNYVLTDELREFVTSQLLEGKFEPLPPDRFLLVGFGELHALPGLRGEGRGG